MQFLEMTMEVHFKLAGEIHPDELKKHERSADPVAAALAERRQQLQEVKSMYDRLRKELAPCSAPEHMIGYYTVLEKAFEQKDEDAGEFLRVLEGGKAQFSQCMYDVWLQCYLQKCVMCGCNAGPGLE